MFNQLCESFCEEQLRSVYKHDIPLFRCLADADGGICAALAFGNLPGRAPTLPRRRSRSEVILHATTTFCARGSTHNAMGLRCWLRTALYNDGLR